MEAGTTIRRQSGDGREGAAASKPGPGQQVAVSRALKLCETQLSACPRAPPAHPPALRLESLDSPGEKAEIASHLLFLEDHCPAVGGVAPLTTALRVWNSPLGTCPAPSRVFPLGFSLEGELPDGRAMSIS